MPLTVGPTLTFLGAAGGTVTGSKHLLEHGGRRLLLDCGLFQGLKALRQRNWAPPPLDPRALGAVVLSHAHIDHSGYLPRLVRDGFAGPVYCTGGTADLLKIMLPDAAHLQEEEAAFANRHKTSRHDPALPLFTTADVERARRFEVLVREGHAKSLVEAGIRFAISNRGMSTILVGYSTFDQLEYAAAAADKGPLPQVALDRLAALWREQR